MIKLKCDRTVLYISRHHHCRNRPSDSIDGFALCFQQDVCCPLRRDGATLEHNELSGQLCQLMGGVSHLDQRDPLCGQPFSEMPDQLLSVIGIICREGFIQQEQSWSR